MQLFSTFLNPVPRANHVTNRGLDTPRFCDSCMSWTLCLTRWHWGLFCLLLNPQLWCWKLHFKGLLWLLFSLSLLPLHPPDCPWGNCAQGTFSEPIPCACIHHFLFIDLKSHILHFSWSIVCMSAYAKWSLVLLRALPNASVEIILPNLSLSFSAIPCCWVFLPTMEQTTLPHSGSCCSCRICSCLSASSDLLSRLHHSPIKVHRCLVNSGHSSELLPQVEKAPLSFYNFLVVKCLKAWSAHLCSYSGLKLLWCSCTNSQF